MNSPPAWNMGVITGETSAAVSSQLTTVLMQFHSTCRWEIIAPFGRPVVPDV